METGMLWFDNDPKKSLAQKVAEAAKYYYFKYGRIATACLVNPLALPAGKTEVNFIKVKASRMILPGSLWIGYEKVCSECHGTGLDLSGDSGGSCPHCFDGKVTA